MRFTAPKTPGLAGLSLLRFCRPASAGGQVNYHTPHWHGNVVTLDKHHTDIFSILPAQFVAADMVPDRVGTWMFHCHIDEHMEEGMMAMYQVTP